MSRRLKLDADRAGGSASSVVSNGTVNNFKAPPRALDKNQIAPDISRRRVANSESKEPLAASLSAPRFADGITPAKPQKDKIEANLSEKAERILTQNQAAADKTTDANQSVNQQIDQNPDEQKIDADTVETALNGDAVMAEGNLIPRAEESTAAKNVKKALKNIFS
jgi:hypothetical protein